MRLIGSFQRKPSLALIVIRVEADFCENRSWREEWEACADGQRAKAVADARWPNAYQDPDQQDHVSIERQDKWEYMDHLAQSARLLRGDHRWSVDDVARASGSLAFWEMIATFSVREAVASLLNNI